MSGDPVYGLLTKNQPIINRTIVSTLYPFFVQSETYNIFSFNIARVIFAIDISKEGVTHLEALDRAKTWLDYGSLCDLVYVLDMQIIDHRRLLFPSYQPHIILVSKNNTGLSFGPDDLYKRCRICCPYAYVIEVDTARYPPDYASELLSKMLDGDFNVTDIVSPVSPPICLSAGLLSTYLREDTIVLKPKKIP